MNNWFVYIILCIGITVFDQSSHVAGSQVLRLRGVSSTNKSLYPRDKDFECFDGSLIIPFSYINDDYCDCADGTDEPGTAACSRGKFYCENIGHQGLLIPSGRVNDGFCDCCDGSDEYASKIQCPNICHELGKEARLEAQKAAALQKEGNQIREKMKTQGKQMKSEFQIRLVKLRADYEEAELSKNEKEILKKQAEERESLALEKYKTTEPEHVSEDSSNDKEDNQAEAENYFKMLDSDNSGTLVVSELQTKVTFDKNRDGVVSEEEAMFFLNNQKELTLQEFIETAWPVVKPFAMLEQGMFKPAKTEENVEEAAPELTEDLPKESKEEGAEEEEEAGESEDHEEEQEEPPVQYDEETQSLIDEANGARERFQEAEKAVNDLLSEIRTLESKLNQDYGPEDEFAPLDGECFEHTNLEYVYTLCMFGKATQRSKSGGSDINLGHWHEWVGPKNRKYFRMKYDRGLTCWNGPARTTIVNLSCGKENKLLSVSEPNRCEYKMEFSTPALCNPNLDPLSTAEEDSHDEL